eukprot:COSAG01_NODE_69232_length_262_cov_0.521472_1_plen_44_part_10
MLFHSTAQGGAGTGLLFPAEKQFGAMSKLSGDSSDPLRASLRTV